MNRVEADAFGHRKLGGIGATANAQSLIGYNAQPKAVTLLNEVTLELNKTFKHADFPGLGNYYLVNLSKNQLVVVHTLDTF